jgi:hypothetical protein
LKDETMNNQNFTTRFTVEQSPHEVFEAINDVRGWWEGEIEGCTDVLGAEFTYRYADLHRTTQRITESVPDKKVVWRVVDGNIAFVNDKREWDGTEIVFEIERIGDQTEVRFTHVGLVPAIECYAECSTAWSSLVSVNLRKRIARRS